MKQHRTAIGLSAAAILFCIAYGAHRLLGDPAVQTTDDAYIRADSVLISPRVAGQISKVAVEDNETVRTGQLLAELDNRDYLASQASAAANVQAAKAELKNLEANIDRQAAVIDQAAAATRATAASLKYAQANAHRYQNLSSTGAGTQQEHQKAEAELQGWQANRDRDNAARIEAEKTLDVLKAQHEVAKATLAKNQAELQQAELNLSYTKITAPQDGVIGQRSVRVGAYVSQGQPLMAVVPVRKAFVIANFRETQMGHMRAQQAVQLRIDSFPDHEFKGRIESLAPATNLSFSPIEPDNATGNFTKVAQRVPVKIVFDDNQPDLDRLRIGMSVVVSVDAKEH